MNIAEIINKNAGSKKSQDFKVQMIHYKKLKPSKDNKYSTEQIRELADMIILAGQIKQNIIVRKVDADFYEIVAGHRRTMAVKMIVEDDGLEQFAYLPCKIESLDDKLAEFNLIVTNSTQRERSATEKLHEVARLKKLIPELMGDESIKGRVLRKLVAQTMNTSETTVAQLDAINNNLIPEGKEKLESGDLNVTTAYQISGLPEDRQKEIVQQDNVTVKDVKEIKKTPEKSVSIIDTNPDKVSICEDQVDDNNHNVEEDKVNIHQTIEGNLNPPEPTEPDKGYKIHRVKIASIYYKDVCYGLKTFELRKNDRDYHVGDILEMMEFKDGHSTGNQITAEITYMLGNYTGLKDGYCILGINVMDYNIREDMEG